MIGDHSSPIKFTDNHLIDENLKNHKYNPDTEMATMGCVDGNEMIRVRIDGKEINSYFEDIW